MQIFSNGIHTVQCIPDALNKASKVSSDYNRVINKLLRVITTTREGKMMCDPLVGGSAVSVIPGMRGIDTAVKSVGPLQDCNLVGRLLQLTGQGMPALSNAAKHPS